MISRLTRAIAVAVMVALPLAALFGGAARLVPFLAMPLVVLGGPLALARWRGDTSAEDSADDDGGSDGGGGGGGGSHRPGRGPEQPSGPRGELPLERSQPGRWRVRGPERQHVSDPGRRRTPHRAPLRPRVPTRHP
ncbi:MAG TPA: hypothetical protein VFN48_09015 [Solirubrobacteraceae bacterium]|nr:hypothetical protein [Solirubrobacteraceae bacterium]